jgi:hypothetical protein
MTTVSALPPVPSRGNPATFSTLFEAFLTALQGDFVSQVNTVAGEVNTKATAAATSASTASTQASAASSSASSAASSATAAAASALAGAAFKGAWSGLSGPLAVPASVAHGGRLWTLLSNVADVTAKTPGIAAEWQVYAARSTDILAPVQAVAALAIDCSLSTYFTKTVAANSTFTFTNVPADRAYACTLELTHTSGAVTWPAAVKWAQDTAPTLTTGKVHLFVFITDDGGTRWRGAALANYVS